MRVPLFEGLSDRGLNARAVIEHAAHVEERAVPGAVPRVGRLREHLHAEIAELLDASLELKQVSDEPDEPQPIRLDLVGVVPNHLAHEERRFRRLRTLDLAEHVVQRPVHVLIGPHQREQQMIVQHLRVRLQRGQHLREVLHGFVIEEHREAGRFIDGASVDLADDLDRLPEVRAELVTRDPDLLFGCGDDQVRVRSFLCEPLEVAFDHRALSVGVFAELFEREGVRLDAKTLAGFGVRHGSVFDRVFECRHRIDLRPRRVVRLQRLMHPCSRLQRTRRAGQLRRETAHMTQPVSTLATLEIPQVRLRNPLRLFAHVLPHPVSVANAAQPMPAC